MSVMSSFGGVNFYTRQVSEQGFERSVVVHNFPLGNDPYLELLGTGTQTFEFDAFVDNTMGLYVDRTLLRNVMINQGIAELIHPSLGSFQAACVNVSMSESARNKGIIDLRLTFITTSNTKKTFLSFMSSDSQSSLSSYASKGLSTVQSVMNGTLLQSTLGSFGSDVGTLVSSGQYLMNQFGGADAVLGKIGQTVGRFNQVGSIGSSLLNSIDTTGDVAKQLTSSVISQRSSSMLGLSQAISRL